MFAKLRANCQARRDSRQAYRDALTQLGEAARSVHHSQDEFPAREHAAGRVAWRRADDAAAQAGVSPKRAWDDTRRHYWDGWQQGYDETHPRPESQ